MSLYPGGLKTGGFKSGILRYTTQEYRRPVLGKNTGVLNAFECTNLLLLCVFLFFSCTLKTNIIIMASKLVFIFLAALILVVVTAERGEKDNAFARFMVGSILSLFVQLYKFDHQVERPLFS